MTNHQAPKQARAFALAKIDDKTLEPDPARVLYWGLESPAGTIVYGRDEKSGPFIFSADSAEKAELHLGLAVGAGLIWF